MGMALTLVEHAAQEARCRRPHRALLLGGVVERAACIRPPGVSSLGHSSHIVAIQVEDLGNLLAHLRHRGPAARRVQGQTGRAEVRRGRAAGDRDRAGLRVSADTGGRRHRDGLGGLGRLDVVGLLEESNGLSVEARESLDRLPFADGGG